MDYTPIDARTDEAVLTQTPAPGSSFPSRPRLGPEVLRYRGMVMNTITGLILIHGRPAHLAVKERELLAALMRRAGQIVNPKWLAEQLHASVAEIEELTARLNAELREAGASCLPRHVEGLGYILWH
jgi:DNA-binding response OmpR family regulator